jgi:hypothetical protein
VEGLPKEEEVSATRRRGSLAVAGLLIVAAIGAARPALADGDDDPNEVNLNKARKLMESRATLDQACSWLANAYSITRRGDVLLNLAECHRRQGKIATAWGEFDEAIRIGTSVKFPEAVAAATKLRDDLAVKISRVTVSVPPAIAARPDLVIELDKKPLPRPKWNAPATHDPGTVEVTARAKGYKPFATQVEIGPTRDDKTIEIGLEAEPPPPPAPPPPPPPPAAARPSPWPWVVGGVGLALGGAAIAFEIDSKSAGKELDRHCGGAKRDACLPRYDFESTRARELRGYDLFLVLGVTSVAAIGTATTVLVLRTTKRAGTTSLQVTPGAVFLRSSF